jgi:HEAT repeat protein
MSTDDAPDASFDRAATVRERRDFEKPPLPHGRGSTLWRRLSVLVTLLAPGCGGGADVDALIAQLGDADSNVRITAAAALGKLGADAEAAVAPLQEALRDPHPEVRQASARSLGEIGAAAPDAVAALESALNDEDLRVQLAAAWALVKLDSAGRKYVPVLTATMKLGEGGTIVAVGNLGSSADWAVPTLVELLSDQRPNTRRLAAEALGRIGPTGDAVKALQQATQDADDRVRAAASAALSQQR